MARPKTEQIRVGFPGGVSIWTEVVSRDGSTGPRAGTRRLVVRLIHDYPDWRPRIGDRVTAREGTFEVVSTDGPDIECARVFDDDEVTTA